MNYFLNLRAGDYGAVCAPYLIAGNPFTPTPSMSSMPYEIIPTLVKGKNVLLVTHGFNVNYVDGLHSLGRLQNLINATDSEFIFGVLWPGDWVIPAINYPFTESIASNAGQFLGAFCNTWLSAAQSISLASHSLGARVMLETAKSLARNVRNICIMAGAVEADCLTGEFKTATNNCTSAVTLSSLNDLVLALAYPSGDLIADILDEDHVPFQRALGREGPQSPYPSPPITAAQIGNKPPYNHSDYLPPSDLAVPVPDPLGLWTPVADFVARAFRGREQIWPTNVNP